MEAETHSPQTKYPCKFFSLERYLVPVLYPGELTREIQIALGLAVLLINLSIYGLLLRRRKSCAEGKGQHFT